MIETREAIENLDSILDLEVMTNFAQKIIVFDNKVSLRDWMVHSWVPAISQSLSEFPLTSDFPSANTLLPDGMSFSILLFLCCPFHNNNFLFGLNHIVIVS